MKLDKGIDSFFAWLLPRKLSTASVEAYRQDLDMITRLLADDASTLTIDDLTKDNIRAAFGSYSACHSKASILRAHSTWRQFFDFLVADGIVEGNPMAAVNKPKRDERKPKPLDGWDEDTMVRLLRSLANGDRGGKYPWPELDVAVVSTLLATGVRSSELLAMNVGAIEGGPGNGVIRVVGKGAKPRTIPVEDGLDGPLGIYLESRKARYPLWRPRNDDALFVAPKQTAPNDRRGGVRMNARQLHWMLDQGLKAAGLANRRHKGAMAHAFRHTYGTTLAADGAPVAAIRKLMGHSSIDTSQGYIDSLAREERDVAARNRVYDILKEISA